MADNNDVTRHLAALVDQISTIIVGKRAQIEDCVACLLAGGHLLNFGRWAGGFRRTLRRRRHRGFVTSCFH